MSDWKFPVGSLVRHKSGRYYVIIAHAIRVSGGHPDCSFDYVYQAQYLDRQIFTRNHDEFEDGRFTLADERA